MRTVFSLLLLLLATAGSLPTPGYAEERRFLTTAGFVNLTENFQNEEVEICMVEELTNEDLRELGVHTIGARARLRAAAREWLQHDGTRDQAAALPDQAARDQDAARPDQDVQDQDAAIPDQAVRDQDAALPDQAAQGEDAPTEDALTFFETTTLTGKV